MSSSTSQPSKSPPHHPTSECFRRKQPSASTAREMNVRFEHLLDSLDQPSRKWVEERDTKNPAVTLWMILTGEEGEMLKGRYFKFCHAYWPMIETTWGIEDGFLATTVCYIASVLPENPEAPPLVSNQKIDKLKEALLTQLLHFIAYAGMEKSSSGGLDTLQAALLISHWLSDRLFPYNVEPLLDNLLIDLVLDNSSIFRNIFPSDHFSGKKRTDLGGMNLKTCLKDAIIELGIDSLQRPCYCCSRSRSSSLSVGSSDDSSIDVSCCPSLRGVIPKEQDSVVENRRLAIAHDRVTQPAWQKMAIVTWLYYLHEQLSWTIPDYPEPSTSTNDLPAFIHNIKTLIIDESVFACCRKYIDPCGDTKTPTIGGIWLMLWDKLGSERHAMIVAEVQVIYYSRETMRYLAAAETATNNFQNVANSECKSVDRMHTVLQAVMKKQSGLDGVLKRFDAQLNDVLSNMALRDVWKSERREDIFGGGIKKLQMAQLHFRCYEYRSNILTVTMDVLGRFPRVPLKIPMERLEQATAIEWVEMSHEAAEVYRRIFYRQRIHDFLPYKDLKMLILMSLAVLEVTISPSVNEKAGRLSKKYKDSESIQDCESGEKTARCEGLRYQLFKLKGWLDEMRTKWEQKVNAM